MKTLEEVFACAERVTMETVKLTGPIDEGHAIVVGIEGNGRSVMFDVYIANDHVTRALLMRATGAEMRRRGCTMYSFSTAALLEDDRDGMVVGACNAHMAIVGTYIVDCQNNMIFVHREIDTCTPILAPFTTMLMEEHQA